MKRLLLLALPLLSLATLAHADPLDIKTVPADSKWVLHLDADALTKTQTWKLLEPKLQQNPQYTQGVADLEKVFAAKFPDDLHDLTLFGPSFEDKAAVIVINASIDQERLKTLLSVNESYTSQTISGYTVHGWIDKGKQMYGGFAEGNRLIISQTADRVAAAMDTLAGKTEYLKDEALVGGDTKPGIFAYAAGSELAKLAAMKAAKNPIISKLQSAWIRIGEDAAGAELTGHVVADDETVAQNITKSIDGIKAALSLADSDDSNASLLADALNGLTAKTSGKTVDLQWTLPTQLIGKTIDRRSSATQPK